jgi:hypothetical protein
VALGISADAQQTKQTSREQESIHNFSSERVHNIKSALLPPLNASRIDTSSSFCRVADSSRASEHEDFMRADGILFIDDTKLKSGKR